MITSASINVLIVLKLLGTLKFHSHKYFAAKLTIKRTHKGFQLEVEASGQGKPENLEPFP